MIVQHILHVPFELSLMHCELGSSKNQITFDYCHHLSGVSKLVNCYCKGNSTLCFGVYGTGSNKEI